jgi:rsbT co-antagonist protein RsbR
MSDPAAEAEELASLRRHAAELSQELARSQATAAQRSESEGRLRVLLDALDEAVCFICDGVIVDANARLFDIFGCAPDDILNKPMLTYVAPEEHARVIALVRQDHSEPYETRALRKDGSSFVAEVCGRTVVHRGGKGRVVLLRDITARKRAEQATRAAAVQAEVIRAQEAILAELSTPLLPISDEVLVLPLVGAVNAQRAEQAVETLVNGIARFGARIAILDVTGLLYVDAPVAEALLRAARAARLLGAEVILTGIRPDVAERLVNLGADLTGIVTCGTLERGVAHALGRRGVDARGGHA